MSAQITIPPINAQHTMGIGISLGLRAAINILSAADDKFGKLPGYNTAKALIESLEAEQRAAVAGSNFRAATKAGIDISTHMIGLIGRGKIYAEPMDLEQLAEFGA